MRENVCIPAVRLPGGEILKGEPHTILCMRAFERGISEGLIGGHIDRRGVFCPVYRTPEDAWPFKVSTREYGIELANSGDWIKRWAAGDLVKAGRDDSDGLQAYIDRWDSFCNIGLTPAIKNVETGEVFCGVELHGELSAQHPELSYSRKTEVADGSITPGHLSVGWAEVETKRYISREQAREYSISVTGYATSTNLISGEEWFIKLETTEDAKYLGRHWHRHGFYHAKNRSNIFKNRGINLDYVALLETAITEYELEKKRGNT